MASSRNIHAPGIELREIDRSAYSRQDNSLPNAPAVFMTGFADKGDNYNVKWINSLATFEREYGAPSTEFEKIFYNSCAEVLNRGGVCLASKLPYDNDESRKYTFCDYDVFTQHRDITQTSLSALSAVDSTLTSCIELASSDRSGKISCDVFDQLKTGELKSIVNNKIRIVDISKGRMRKAGFDCVTTVDGGVSHRTNECLGTLPVIVTPHSAVFWQYLKNSSSIAQLSDYNAADAVSCVNPQSWDVAVDLSQLSANEVIHVSSDDINEQTISKIAAAQFPQIQLMSEDRLNADLMKSICIVVFQAYADTANRNKVNYKVAESFVGSLDRRAKNANGSSNFIDDIVNSSSTLINVFSNVESKAFDTASTVVMRHQVATMLGFYDRDCKKAIAAGGNEMSILKSLDIVLDMTKDSNQYQFDIVADAGMSNIAQYVSFKSRMDLTTSESTSFTDSEIAWNVADTNDTSTWRAVLNKLDNFCKSTRRDCMFVADILRPFCLEGNQKVVRKTKIGSSVEKDILPKLKLMNALNSSYSAGYCDWFLMNDYYSGDLIWCPPSVKAVSIMTYCDTYFHTWDAPAGMTRGIVPNVVDVAFSPTSEEAGKLYDQCWNYAINYPIDGIVMEGQKTFQLNKTAFDRINVRRLLLWLEKRVARAAKYFLYEGNTPYMRQKFVDTVRPIFEDAVRGSGILEYAIKCDDELNTAQVIDNNELRCKIAVKPVKTIEYIVIDLVTTAQSASVSEEVLK